MGRGWGRVVRGLGLLCLYAQPVGGLGCRGLRGGGARRQGCRRIRLRCALRKAAHVGAQLLQLGLSLVKGLIDGLRQAVQIQRGGAQPFIHAGQTLPHQHNARGDAAGILGHAVLLAVCLLLQLLLGALGVQAGIGQNLTGLKLCLPHQIGRGGAQGRGIQLAR